MQVHHRTGDRGTHSGAGPIHTRSSLQVQGGGEGRSPLRGVGGRGVEESQIESQIERRGEQGWKRCVGGGG